MRRWAQQFQDDRTFIGLKVALLAALIAAVALTEHPW